MGKSAEDCQVERLGHQVIVRGPTQYAVREYIANLVTGGAPGGARLLDIAEQRGEWTAILEAPR